MLRVVLACFIIVSFVVPAHGGPVLDEILNYTFLDQGTPLEGGPQLFKVDGAATLTKDAPMGQTFVTGPDTDRIARIEAWMSPDKEWQRGEGAELVLWDSPEKKVSLGRYTIWYEYRGFVHGKADWEINARVRPNTSYYFEISYVGSGDGVLSKHGTIKGRDSYPSGQGYKAGKEADFDLSFQVHSRRSPNPIGNLKKAFARFNLSRPELAEAKAAVDKEDFETAIAKTVAHFEARKEPTSIIDPKDEPKFNPDFDTTQADLALHNYFETREVGKGYAGPDLNWHAAVDFDDKGSVVASNYDLNRYGPRGALGNAYLNTGNDKYARKLNDFFVDWYMDNPPPGESKIGGHPWDGVWTSLNTGIRLGHGFVAYSKIHASPFFTTDCRFAYILGLADHADTLVLVGGSAGGNWSFTQNSSMFDFSLNFPEFTNAPVWQQTASDRIAASLKNDWLPDGIETESAPGYQRMCYKPLAALYELAQARGVETSFARDLRKMLETQSEYFMYLTMPNVVTPALGDWGDVDERGYLAADSERFNRPDMLYVATAGKEGTKPKEHSKLYPYAGIVTMRSDWGDAGRPYGDARYLMLHGVHMGAHGHEDLNTVDVYAYGRELLTDPGSHIYGSPEHNLLTQSVSHNLMTIDGNHEKDSAAEFRNWATTPAVDYVSSWLQLPNKLGYCREVFYVRANGDPAKDYWVVRDTGEGTGQHLLEQRWHFNPGELTVDDKTLTSRIGYTEGANLAIMQLDPGRLQYEKTTADTWRPRGANEKPTKLPVVIYKWDKAELPAAIDTVLFPYEGKTMPELKIERLAAASDGQASAFRVVQGKTTDLFVTQASPAKTSLASEKAMFDGDRLFVRRVGGKLRSAFMANGTSLAIGGKEIVSTAKPLSWVEVSFEGKSVKVRTSADEPSLKIPAAKGLKLEVVNANTDPLVRLRSRKAK